MVSSASLLWIEPRASGEIRCNAAHDDRHGLMCKWSLGRRDKSPAKRRALADEATGRSVPIQATNPHNLVMSSL
jgi:hypothetical protein